MRPRTLILAVAVTMVASGWVVMARRGGGSPSATPLDPTAYRTLIEAVDREVYRGRGPSPAQAQALLQSLASLTRAIDRDYPAPTGRPSRAMSLHEFTAAVPRATDGTFTSAATETWWAETRAGLFTPAPWFLTESAPPPPDPRREVLARLRRSHGMMRSAVTASRSLILDVPDDPPMTGTTARTRYDAQWTAVTNRVQRQIEAARDQIPSVPRSDRAARRIAQDLHRAARDMLTVVKARAAPPRAYRASNIASVLRTLDLIARRLAEAEGS